MEWLKAGFLTGVLGDASLQLYDPDGLREYFQYQGPLISVLKAGGLTAFWSWLYGAMIPNPSITQFVLYAGAVDVLYRYAYPILYPTLEGYYNNYSVLHTILNNMIVGLMVWYAKEWIK